MKYVVKLVSTATENNVRCLGEVQTWYIGKGGYVYNNLKYADGWSRRHFAEKYIREDISNREYFGKGKPVFWKNEYTIVEVPESGKGADIWK